MRCATAPAPSKAPGLICASILSKKLAAGLDALVLDVKTGSGAFLRKQEDAEYLAALMVATAEAAGTRTVALLTDMGQPLGHAAGNWIELVESVELLRNHARNKAKTCASCRSSSPDG
jgi:thymidine phosphorylase